MDILDISRMFFGLLTVLAMIGLCALAAKRAGIVANGGAFGSKRRLQLVETLALDARRRIAIVRCDGREHLVLVGPASEMLIDADIPARPADATPLPQTFPIAEALKRFKARSATERADAA